MSKQLQICFDYDGTYDADPQLWVPIISMMKGRGHRVILATMRDDIDGERLPEEVTRQFDRVYYTGRQAKLIYLQNLLGLKVDIWIEDRPDWLFNDG